MSASRQVPTDDESVAAITRALDELALLRRGRPGPGGRGGWRGPFPSGMHGDLGAHPGPEAMPDGPPWMRGRGGFGPHGRGGSGDRPHGGPHQRQRMMAVHRALGVLADAGEPLSITELGAAIGIDQPRASRIVQVLQQDGLVRREPDPADARRARVALTAKGRAQAAEHRERRAAPVAEALAVLDETERAQLAVLLARLVDGWPRG